MTDMTELSGAPEPYRPLIHTQADLEEVWRFLVRPLGFGRRSIWLLQVGSDRRPTPLITEITECEDRPDPAQGSGLATVLREAADWEPGGSFAFLLTRPGHGILPEDRAWALFLHETGRTAGVHLEVIHLATDDDIVPLPLDELSLSA